MIFVNFLKMVIFGTLDRWTSLWQHIAKPPSKGIYELYRFFISIVYNIFRYIRVFDHCMRTNTLSRGSVKTFRFRFMSTLRAVSLGSLSLRDSRAKRTRERARKWPAAWKRHKATRVCRVTTQGAHHARVTSPRGKRFSHSLATVLERKLRLLVIYTNSTVKKLGWRDNLIFSSS